MEKEKRTHVFTVHHFGHTRLDFFTDWETGLSLAKQASEQLRIQGKWKRGPLGDRPLLEDGKYIDSYREGVITVRPLETSE